MPSMLILGAFAKVKSYSLTASGIFLKSFKFCQVGLFNADSVKFSY